MNRPKIPKKGFHHSARGCEERATPGYAPRRFTLKGLHQSSGYRPYQIDFVGLKLPRGRIQPIQGPFRVENKSGDCQPRVARSSQPWAARRNPVGIEHQAAICRTLLNSEKQENAATENPKGIPTQSPGLRGTSYPGPPFNHWSNRNAVAASPFRPSREAFTNPLLRSLRVCHTAPSAATGLIWVDGLGEPGRWGIQRGMVFSQSFVDYPDSRQACQPP